MLKNCGSPFVTAEQCKSNRSLKEAKAHRKTGAPFTFRETGFFRKNLTATRNYSVVGDVPTHSGSELLPAIGRWSNPTNAISDALTLTQHQRKVTTRFRMELSRGLKDLRSLLLDDLSRFERTLADHRNPIPSATPNFYTLMNTPTLTQRREILAKAWKNYVTIRRAYCNRKATVQQLAHALALVGVAEVKAEINNPIGVDGKEVWPTGVAVEKS